MSGAWQSIVILCISLPTQRAQHATSSSLICAGVSASQMCMLLLGTSCVVMYSLRIASRGVSVRVLIHHTPGCRESQRLAQALRTLTKKLARFIEMAVNWPGLMAWSTQYHDGTAPSNFTKMSDENREFLEKAMEDKRTQQSGPPRGGWSSTCLNVVSWPWYMVCNASFARPLC